MNETPKTIDELIDTPVFNATAGGGRSLIQWLTRTLKEDTSSHVTLFLRRQDVIGLLAAFNSQAERLDWFKRNSSVLTLLDYAEWLGVEAADE